MTTLNTGGSSRKSDTLGTEESNQKLIFKAHHADPITSHLAAAQVDEKLCEKRIRLISEYVVSVGKIGAIASEISEATGIDYHTVQRLKNKCVPVIVESGRRRPGPSGKGKEQAVMIAAIHLPQLELDLQPS
jgi:hypothetical protein